MTQSYWFYIIITIIVVIILLHIVLHKIEIFVSKNCSVIKYAYIILLYVQF